MVSSEFNRSLYNSWNGMMRRCSNKRSPYYSDYGGRGIAVSTEWRDYRVFLSAMSQGWRKGLTLERKDNNGNYSKSNCRWATREEQANNRRSSKIVTYKGEARTLAQWIKNLGLKSSTVRQRYYVYHWDLDRCFSRGR